MTPFIPGQRWISETEPELGLGTILQAEGRQVMVVFTASGEVRNYASSSAPLERALLRPGETATPAEGEPFRVTAVEERDGLLVYLGDGQELAEPLLSDTAMARRPEDRLLHGQADEPGAFTHRLKAWQHRARLHRSPVRGFVGARMDLIPHQLYIASKAVERMAPRILLADEVGLGKTIEACLILQRLLITGRAQRVLIMIPEALIHQWFVELLRRFNLSFSIYDEERCVSITSGNPFLDEQLILAPDAFFDAHPKRRQQAIEAGWDLLVIDEAHHLEWAPDGASDLYHFADTLARSTPGVLLLTATPEELGPESHFARLHLLDPKRYPDLEAFHAEHERFADTVHQAHELLDQGKPIDDLLDRYGPGRVIFRNARRGMKGFPKRKVYLAPLAPGTSKVKWLAELLRKLKDEKVLLITSTKQEVLQLNEALTREIKVKTGMFHENMDLIQRDRLAAWFAEEDGARILLCSQIGGEGRNFQFAHHLVLYNLPEHPESIEQRIGRLDRIGQRETVHIHVPYATGGKEERWVRWLHEGLDVFETCLQGAEEIFQHFKDQMDGDLNKLIKKTVTYRKKLKARLEAGANRLLELHSFEPKAAKKTVAAIRELGQDPEFEPFILNLFDHVGIHAEEIGTKSYRLVPGHTYRDGLPGFAKEGMTVTLDRTTALDREDWIFLSWDHPMVTGAIDNWLGTSEGSGAVVTWPHCEREGLAFEAVYILEPTAPPAWEVGRFLPAAAIRTGSELSGDPLEELPPLDLPDARMSGILDMGEALTDHVRNMLEGCHAQAEKQAAKLRKEARKAMKDQLGTERDRLEYLSGINDHVDTEEVEALKERIEEIDACLAAAVLRLDAVRLIVKSS